MPWRFSAPGRAVGQVTNRRVSWDVDTRRDFMRGDGTLYVPDAESIIPNFARLTEHAHGIRIVASADDHLGSDAEISDALDDWTTTFPPHGLRGTPGQAKISETRLRDALTIDPDRLDAIELPHRLRAHPADILLRKRRGAVFSNQNAAMVLPVAAVGS